MTGVATWDFMDAAARERYKREHDGHGPPGYRATGMVEWFQRHHSDTAPCCKCGIVTDRWVVGAAQVQFVSWGTPHVDQVGEQKKRALCWENVWPFCQRCEDIHSIAVLKQRQLNMNIYPALRAREADYLAELEANLGPKERAA